jgi:glycosyltransferase involved in cell wall biosynthesis
MQREGGLDAAIDGLRAALARAGETVDDALPVNADGERVAHFHGLWQPVHARLARECAAKRIAVIASPHGMLEPWAMRHKAWKKWPYFYLVERRRLAHADAVLATSETEAARLRRLLPGTCVEALPLGMTGDARPDYEAARAKLAWSRDERVVLFLSRLHVKKGVELLLRALAMTERAEPTRLVIVGDGDARHVESLRKLAAQMKDSLPRIEWVGAVWGEARWPFFQGADLFCLPTFSENFGLAVLEACQVGTPSLTTTATPWAEYLSAGRGLICEPTVESLGVQLTRFFSNPRQTPDARAALADWTWSRFHWDALVGRYLALYRSVLHEPD